MLLEVEFLAKSIDFLILVTVSFPVVNYHENQDEDNGERVLFNGLSGRLVPRQLVANQRGLIFLLVQLSKLRSNQGSPPVLSVIHTKTLIGKHL